ncbi:hypothetical protein ACSC9U_30105 [Pseudomonas solani]|uniref:hypothetical protein n=1 Tax=Pseudomonas TaxID=286 RepID=UPI001F165A7F|nr:MULTISPECIES: hypothetical protein [Pseudomonas]
MDRCDLIGIHWPGASAAGHANQTLISILIVKSVSGTLRAVIKALHELAIIRANPALMVRIK